MNTKLLLTAVLLAYFGHPVFSQEKLKQSDKLGAYRTTYKKNGLKDNWQISLGAGAQVLAATDDSKAQMKDRITFAPTIAFGKYFSPIWGLRLRASGATLKGYNDGMSGIYSKWNSGEHTYQGRGYAGRPGYPEREGPNFFTWDPQWNHLGFSLENKQIVQDPNGSYKWAGANRDGTDENVNLYKQNYTYISAGVDFMFDVLTLFGTYNPRRLFELSPFGGMSYHHVFEQEGRKSYDGVGVTVGVTAKFRITDKIKVFAEGSGSVLPDSFDGELGGSTAFDGLIQGLGGVSYDLGKNTWSVCEPANFHLIDDLNKQINDLKAALRPCPTCPPCPPALPPIVIQEDSIPPKEEIEEIIFLPDPVFFRINQAVIDPSEWEKLEKAVAFLTKKPNVKVIVTGYADKHTATPAYNLKLSEQRAKVVAKALVENYGLNPLRVSVNWKGDAIQPFNINEWNRVVIFVLKY